jgi:hypothetical protein
MITHYHLSSHARNLSTPNITLPAFAAFKKSEFAPLIPTSRFFASGLATDVWAEPRKALDVTAGLQPGKVFCTIFAAHSPSIDGLRRILLA